MTAEGDLLLARIWSHPTRESEDTEKEIVSLMHFPKRGFFPSSSCFSKRLERSNSKSACVVSLVRSGEAQRDTERRK